MNRTSAVKAFFFGLSIVSFGSCSLFNAPDRPTRVAELVSWIERVHVESELAKQKMQVAVTNLAEIAASDFTGSPVDAYTRFVKSIDESELQADTLRDAVRSMKSSATPLFEQWTKDLENYSNAAMRTRSLQRLEKTRGRYDNVVATVDPALATLEVFNRGLRDHALFLGLDFNPDSVRMIQDDVIELSRLSQDIGGQLNDCLAAAEEYINSHALPGTGGQFAAPQGETKKDDDK